MNPEQTSSVPVNVPSSPDTKSLKAAMADNRSKVVIGIAVTAVLLALIAVGAVLALNNANNRGQNNNSQSQTTSTAQTTQSAQTTTAQTQTAQTTTQAQTTQGSTATTSMKECKSPVIKVSIMIPQNWTCTLQDDSAEAEAVLGGLKAEGNGYSIELNNGGFGDICGSEGSGCTVEEWLKLDKVKLNLNNDEVAGSYVNGELINAPYPYTVVFFYYPGSGIEGTGAKPTAADKTLAQKIFSTIKYY